MEGLLVEMGTRFRDKRSCRGINRPFQTQQGMGEIRWNIGIINSRIKKYKLNGYPYAVICGCSNSCGFAYLQEHIPAPITDKDRYKLWLKNHANS